METNVVAEMGSQIAQSLGSALYEGVTAAESALGQGGDLTDMQSSLGSILLMFVGIAALFYVGRWLYKAFKRGAA